MMDKYSHAAELLSAKEIKFTENELLAPHSTFRIGGEARLAAMPDTTEQIIDAVSAAKEAGLDFTVIGNGSNVLFSDKGFDGLVIFTRNADSVVIKGKRVIADAGAPFTKLAVTVKNAGLTGLEFAYGIPGSVGGAVYMNAGAYNGEASQVVASSMAYDDLTGEVRMISREEHNFGYRTSVYSQNRDRLTVLSAEFELKEGDSAAIWETMQDLMRRRREKQPLEYPNAGSVFKRPQGYFVGKLITDAGLKGYTIGGAQVSEKHAGFIVNIGGATAEDVLRLVEHIQKTVQSQFGVMLECEINFKGQR